MDLEKTIRNLKARQFTVRHFAAKEEAADYLVQSIHHTTVGIGGSTTIEQLNIYDRLTDDNQVSWHWKDTSPDIFEREMLSKVFLSSANAIAETGEIVNIDARGNRIGSLAYGFGKTVYLVAGINKICPDLDAAIFRARNIAAPQNVKRLSPEGAPNPCIKGGKCFDCRLPERMCGALLVLWGKMKDCEKYEVLLIDEALGL